LTPTKIPPIASTAIRNTAATPVFRSAGVCMEHSSIACGTRELDQLCASTRLARA
jgi:hypothetical protein